MNAYAVHVDGPFARILRSGAHRPYPDISNAVDGQDGSGID